MCTGQRGDFTNVVGRSDLNEIHPHQIDTAQTTDNAHCLMRTQTTANRCAGPGCVTGIETIDVKRQIHGSILKRRTRLFDYRLDAVLMNPRTIEDVEAKRVRVACPQTHLHGSGGIDNALLRSMVKHRAVVYPPVFVSPCVAMRIEMQQ